MQYQQIGSPYAALALHKSHEIHINICRTSVLKDIKEEVSYKILGIGATYIPVYLV